VVSVAGDGEVPHPAVVPGGDGAAVGDCGDTVGGLEVLAQLELGRSTPLLQRRSVDWTNWFWVINLRALRDGGDYGRVP
jgi:hypothetical protein